MDDDTLICKSFEKILSPQHIINISFNQNSNYFVITLENGFQVYCSETFELTKKTELSFCVHNVKMLYNSNLFGLISKKVNTPDIDRFIIWDDSNKLIYCEKEFEKIKYFKLKKEKIFILTTTKIHVHFYFQLELYITIDILSTNPIMAISNNPDISHLAYSSEFTDGFYHVKLNYFESSNRLPAILKPHRNFIAYLNFSHDGTLLSTCSENGKNLKVYNVDTLELLHSFRRGVHAASISSLKFSLSSILGCVSERNTVHLFSLEKKNNGLISLLYNQSSMKITVDNKNNSTLKLRFIDEKKLIVYSNCDEFLIIEYDYMNNRHETIRKSLTLNS